MTDRLQLLKQINEVSFVVDDLTLYLDTHPLDTDAMDYFKQMSTQRKELLKTYAENYEPLTRNCVCPDTNNQTKSFTKYPQQRHWTWSDGPVPWDAAANTNSPANIKGGV
ncbi:spore coat protein CotJB [Clostridium sp. MCC353]|uniref:spore coat protein CotJB n=1 Tax=Clostridium sp. MCC353 TaxID=2592646 RepID=UPI001C01C1B2|nr:spore coat protein CotJB [Clostridium sp. MCC353]MBT9776039.1 spore coat protein CotJB [Clostridium sp. MCC353]